MLIQPYLFFDGSCEEAIEFYKTALGAEVQMMMRYSDSPEPHPPGMLPPGAEKKIMHASFRVGDSIIMASDGDCSGAAKFEGCSLSITLPEDKVEKVFNALAEGGQVRQPLIKTFFSPKFGMVADRFGMGWMVVAEA